jgi:hypothetical protein
MKQKQIYCIYYDRVNDICKYHIHNKGCVHKKEVILVRGMWCKFLGDPF